ncbi:MAG: hypothetical protein RBU37_14125 [Myxococcota bacterium]|nr:hypothetical protein [Myxococcota bacterium]
MVALAASDSAADVPFCSLCAQDWRACASGERFASTNPRELEYEGDAQRMVSDGYRNPFDFEVMTTRLVNASAMPPAARS